MSAPYGEGEQGGQGVQGQLDLGVGDTQNINPAWNDFLNDIPKELHQKAIPHLQEWDKKFEEQVQKVHSEYEPYKPFLDQGYDPDRLDFGVKLTEAMETDPEMVYKAMKDYYKFDDDLSAEQGQDELPEDEEQDRYAAQYNELKHQQDVMANIILQKQKDEEIAVEEVAIDQELSVLEDKYKDRGTLNKGMVLNIALADEELSLEDAAEVYFNWRDSEIAAERRKAPRPLIMGAGGGGVPGQNQPSVTEMSSKDTRNLVAEYMKSQWQARQG